MSFKPVLLFLSFFLAASALTTPHAHRAVHHRALAERIAKPEPVDAYIAPVRRRSNGKRCRPRPSSVTANTSPTSTSVQDPPAPTPSTQSHDAPKPSSPPSPTTSPHHVALEPTHSATTTHQSSPAPSATTKGSPPSSDNLPSFMKGTQTGEGTFYGVGLGACGFNNADSDLIAAVSHDLFDNFPGYEDGNPNHNPICGRKVTAKFKDNQVTVKIVDRCTGCKVTDLDFSPSAFKTLASPDLGRIDITWTWSDV